MKIINSKIFKSIVLLFIVGFILGVVLYYIIGENEEIFNYFDSIKNNSFNYSNNLLFTLTYNSKYIIFIWISGIIIFLSFLIPILIIYRGIINGFIFISIIHLFHLKGLILSLILLFPVVLIYEFVYLIISYYSLNFSIRTFNVIKYNKSINLRNYIKNYFYQFLIFFGLIIINCFFETYITSNIISYVL